MSLKQAARTMFVRSGGLRLARWARRDTLRILMYHRFPDGRALEDQCRHLRECYHLVSLNEATAMLAGGQPLPPNSLAVTVDDGYRDFYTVAYPIFSAYGIRPMVYVVTDFLDGRIWLWVDQVRYAFMHANRLGPEQDRRRAGRETCEALKRLPNAERLAALERLFDELHVTIPSDPPAGCEPLTWDEVRTLARAGVEFGAHTRTHPILSRVSTRPELCMEIAGSRQRLEEMLQSPVRHFCYPNGDISPEAAESVRQAGFETAATTEPGVNSRRADLLHLRRVAVDPTYEPAYFQQCAAAFHV